MLEARFSEQIFKEIMAMTIQNNLRPRMGRSAWSVEKILVRERVSLKSRRQ